MKKLTRSDAEITLSKPLLGAIECNCGCGQKEIDVNLILLMNDIIVEFGVSVLYITSWNRCGHHNALVGGVENSLHTYGGAVDVVFATKHEDGSESIVDVDDVLQHVLSKYPKNVEIGLYSKGRIHLGYDSKGGDTKTWDER